MAMDQQKLSAIFKHQLRHNDAILALLTETTIGTNGAKYRHLHTANKIDDLHQPHYFTLFRHEKAVANITICERPISVGDKFINTFYLRYFAFARSFQTKHKVTSKSKSSVLYTFARELLATSNLNIDEPQFNPKIFWAIIDPENDRSLQMGDRFGFKTIVKIKTLAFSRVKLRNTPQVTRLTEAEKPEVLQLIRHFYEGYNSRSEVHLFKHNHFFVFKDKGEILAGIQANPVAWRIDAFPGKFGKLLVKVIPYVPFVNRIINPANHQFLATEGLFWKKGHENQIDKLLEGVLHLQKCHSMLLWTDERDERVISVLQKTKLGLLQKLKADNTVNLVAKFNHIPIDIQNSMHENLHYISGFDCT